MKNKLIKLYLPLFLVGLISITTTLTSCSNFLEKVSDIQSGESELGISANPNDGFLPYKIVQLADDPDYAALNSIVEALGGVVVKNYAYIDAMEVLLADADDANRAKHRMAPQAPAIAIASHTAPSQIVHSSSSTSSGT